MSLCKADEHIQQRGSNPIFSELAAHRHIVDIPLVQHHSQPGISDGSAVVSLSHNKRCRHIIQFIAQHLLRPGFGKAFPLHRCHIGNILIGHWYQLIMHRLLRRDRTGHTLKFTHITHLLLNGRLPSSCPHGPLPAEEQRD